MNTCECVFLHQMTLSSSFRVFLLSEILKRWRAIERERNWNGMRTRIWREKKIVNILTRNIDETVVFEKKKSSRQPDIQYHTVHDKNSIKNIFNWKSCVKIGVSVSECACAPVCVCVYEWFTCIYNCDSEINWKWIDSNGSNWFVRLNAEWHLFIYDCCCKCWRDI